MMMVRAARRIMVGRFASSRLNVRVPILPLFPQPPPSTPSVFSGRFLTALPNKTDIPNEDELSAQIVMDELLALKASFAKLSEEMKKRFESVENEIERERMVTAVVAKVVNLNEGFWRKTMKEISAVVIDLLKTAAAVVAAYCILVNGNIS